MYTAWTTGDIHGIGPEIILKGFRETRTSGLKPLVIGSAKALRHYNALLDLDISLAEFGSYEEVLSTSGIPDEALPVISVAEPSGPVTPGLVSEDAGHIAMQAIETAARLCLEGKTRAMVTAPVQKEAIARAGYANTGHTDFLADFCDVQDPIMLFHDQTSSLTVALATVHVPL